MEKAVDEKERKREMISSRKELKEWLDYERTRYELGGGGIVLYKIFCWDGKRNNMAFSKKIKNY